MLSIVTPGRRALWVGGVVLMAGACVTYDVEPVLDSPLEQQTIVAQLPTDLGGEGPVDSYYRSIVDQMHHAYLERNLESLQTLVARYDDPRAPGWARDLLPRFRSLVMALAFEIHVQNRSSIVAEAVSIGEVLKFHLQLPPRAGMSVELADEHAPSPVSFNVIFDVEDRDARGDVVRSQSGSVLKLPEEVTLAGDTSLDLPFTLELPAYSSLIRTVKVYVDLIPGDLRINGDQTPHKRVSCPSTELVLYPDGVEPIRRAPRITLQNAMVLGDVDHFGHIFLAAHFMTDQYKEEAMTALIEWVRLGNADQQRVAMAALSMLADADIEVGDRSRWLSWWQRRGKG